MNRIKLAVIGGGSSQWMMGLMRDVYLIDRIEGGEIALVDPKTTEVNAVAAMLRTFNGQRNKSFDIRVLENRREALAKADFVMTTFSPGSMDSFYHDLEIPLEFGIFQPVSMTVGPCGISAAIRTVPVAHEIVQEMEELCPDATLLNVTNPMSCVTRAFNLAAVNVRVVGMCHESHMLGGFLHRIFPDLKCPQDMNVTEYLYRWLPAMEFDFTLAGVNHFVWLTRATFKGEDVIPKIRAFARTHENTRAAGAPYSATENYNAVKLELCRTFGYLPTVGDRHLVEFWPSLCNARNGFARGLGVIKTTVEERRHRCDKSLLEIERIAAGEKEMDWKRSGEEMTLIMETILGGEETTAILNLPNRGQITNVPRDSVVETLARVTKDSITPKPSGELPGPIGSLARLHIDIHEMTVKAALEGDRDLLVQAISLDPLSAGASFNEIGALTDELLLANKEWLPRFFES
jgi:alpha-galactosidase